MPAERLPMRKVREVLRQRYACGASERVIAQSIGIGRTAVGEYIRRVAVIGITWPVPDELEDVALERKLFAPAGYNPPRSKPPRRSSSGPPNPCITPSTERLVVVVNFMFLVPFLIGRPFTSSTNTPAAIRHRLQNLLPDI